MKNIVEEILKAKKEAGGIREVYFVACGGSLGAFYPAKVFLETEGVKLKTGWYNSNEFVHNIPKSFGENTVLILASHKGNTPETVKAAELAIGGNAQLQPSRVEQGVEGAVDDALGANIHPATGGHLAVVGYA